MVLAGREFHLGMGLGKKWVQGRKKHYIIPSPSLFDLVLMPPGWSEFTGDAEFTMVHSNLMVVDFVQ